MRYLKWHPYFQNLRRWRYLAKYHFIRRIFSFPMAHMEHARIYHLNIHVSCMLIHNFPFGNSCYRMPKGRGVHESTIHTCWEHGKNYDWRIDIQFCSKSNYFSDFIRNAFLLCHKYFHFLGGIINCTCVWPQNKRYHTYCVRRLSEGSNMLYGHG